jgi:ATP-dependent Lon protease
MLTALVSLLTNRPIDPRTGITGEITLRGRVMPVGGIKEKVLAAHRSGLRRVILPDLNKRDLHEIPQDIRGQLDFVFARTTDDVLAHAFAPDDSKQAKKKKKTAGTSTAKRASRKRKPSTAGRSPKKKAHRKRIAAGSSR